MAKTRAGKKGTDEAPRHGRARAAGELIGNVGAVAFRRFGFVQASVVSRWSEIVGDRYAKVSEPESIRFPTGKKSGGTLNIVVQGAHAPLMQHLAPVIVERVNRFFGYAAVNRVVFRQGKLPAPPPKIRRTELRP
ncbi:MAG TPA: DciA family protein, partial [Allosphingosinicella sp.]